MYCISRHDADGPRTHDRGRMRTTIAMTGKKLQNQGNEQTEHRAYKSNDANFIGQCQIHHVGRVFMRNEISPTKSDPCNGDRMMTDIIP